MILNSNNSGISFCIPIFKPEKDFFDQLEFLLDSDVGLIQEYVIVETESSYPCSESRLKSIFLGSLHAKLQYIKIQKNQFSHSTTRNLMANLAESTYVVFTTQDVKFPLDFLDHLKLIPDKMSRLGISAVAIRHESSTSVMNDSFNNLTRKFSYESYYEGNPLGVNWWSNNFAIYNREELRALPFPESVSWAEDLAWAKLAVSRGHRLDLYTGTCVFHLNDDDLKTAWKRGKDNRRGIVELSNYLSLEIPKYTFLKEVLGPLVNYLRIEIRFAFINKRLLVSVIPLFKTLLIWSTQATSRYFYSHNFKKLTKINTKIIEGK